MDRMPYVAGQFYPGDAVTMMTEVKGYLNQASARETAPTILAMAPHAGYMFSGAVCGHTLGRANLAKNILLLGPKHSPLGERLAVWPSGNWKVPGCSVPVNESLAAAILASDSRLMADTASHLEEHSLEVILPFLAALDPEVTIVPVALWERNASVLVEIGANLGRAVADFPEPVSIVVSSDMNHMLPDKVTRKLDGLAIAAALTLDPATLFRTVAENRISMCGVMPMTAGLAAARVLGATRAELVEYATSGDVTGEHTQVVGYAGILVS